MPKMYHPALPGTYDDPKDVTHTAYEAVWEQSGWQLIADDSAAEALVAAAAMARSDEADEEE